MPMDTDLTGILFDMDGVLYQGDSAIAGAADVIQWCQQSNIPFLFLTNTTSRPRTALLEKLHKINIHIGLKQLLTPAVAASHWLQQYCQGPIALFVPQATQEEFQTLEIIDWYSAESVGAIVMGDLGEAWDFKTLNTAFQLLMRSPRGTWSYPLLADREGPATGCRPIRQGPGICHRFERDRHGQASPCVF